jgi:diguanylate cyclase (GGDEF)-like protein
MEKPDIAEAPLPGVLIVDDEPANRLALRRLLDDTLQVNVIDAGSGNEALASALVHAESLALILLDVHMPEMDGYEVAQLLQEEESTRSLPVIFLTAAYRDLGHRLKGYAAGAVDYIEKPLEDEILLAKARVFLELWRRQQELQTALDQVAEANLKLQSQAAKLLEAERRLQFQSGHDPLTGLPNRNLLVNAFDQAAARVQRGKSRAALLFCDLDGFKPVNDGLGHEAGDYVLLELGLRLKESLRDADTLARFGGDEFVVLITDLGAAEEAAEVAERLIAKTTQPFDWNDHEIRVGMSVGIAIYPSHGANQHDLILAADRAMYRAKKQGGNRYCFAAGKRESVS